MNILVIAMLSTSGLIALVITPDLAKKHRYLFLIDVIPGLGVLPVFIMDIS